MATFAGATALLVLTVLLLFTGASPPQAEPRVHVPPVSAGDIMFGRKTARVVLLEYADFGCPACSAYQPILEELRQKYANQVLFVFRFFPLPHSEYGMLAAEAAYAAQLQGRFWKMAHLLYANVDTWSQSVDPRVDILGYAKELGLDLERFRADAKATQTVRFITKEKSGAVAAGGKVVPWFLLNGRPVAPQSYQAFESLLDQAIRQVGG